MQNELLEIENLLKNISSDFPESLLVFHISQAYVQS